MKYLPWYVNLVRPARTMAPRNEPIPSAAASMPPRAGPTFKTSVATTGMKYCRGNTIPFMINDTVRTPSTNLSENEWPIPDLMPCRKAVSRTIRGGALRETHFEYEGMPPGHREPPGTMNAPVNP